MQRITHGFAALLACIVGFSGATTVHAAPKTSEDNVKITAKADKQIVTLTVEVAKDWHLYANPVGNPDMLGSQTVVTLLDGGKPVEAKIKYPEGKLKTDKVAGDYKIYEGTITITATLAAPPAGQLEAVVAVSTCNDSTCLLPAKVKLKVK